MSSCVHPLIDRSIFIWILRWEKKRRKGEKKGEKRRKSLPNEIETKKNHVFEEISLRSVDRHDKNISSRFFQQLFGVCPEFSKKS